MSEINDKTSIPLGWAASIVLALVSAVASGAVAQYRINAHEEALHEIKMELKDKTKADINRDLGLQSLGDKMDAVTGKLDEVKESVERLGRRLDREPSRSTDHR